MPLGFVRESSDVRRVERAAIAADGLPVERVVHDEEAAVQHGAAGAFEGETPAAGREGLGLHAQEQGVSGKAFHRRDSLNEPRRPGGAFQPDGDDLGIGGVLQFSLEHEGVGGEAVFF